MLQILGLRSFKNEADEEKKYDAFFEKKWRAHSIQDLFENLDDYLKEIPAKERWNLYFTPNNCTDKKREFSSTSVVFFDLDKIDTTQVELYIEGFCRTLKVKREETGIVFSGNGLHFYIGLLVPIVDKDTFLAMREHYKAILTQLSRTFAEMGLPVELDPKVYDVRRLMRLPGTINRKPGKPDKKAELLQGNVVPVNFDIMIASGVPNVRKEDQIAQDFFKKFPKVDNKAVMEGCSFLKFCKNNPAKINEPDWYAALSIVGRMENGAALAHEISRGHPSYSASETDLKLQQALMASGPRTCKSINNSWGKCSSCPNFEKVNSPIMIRGEDSSPTEHTGFHTMVWDEETGKMKRGKPCYEDLLKFFERTHKFVSHDKFVWVWRETHWKEIGNFELEAFAQKHFNPFATSAMTEEFRKLVWRSNLVNPVEIADRSARKVNFKNGILDLESGTFGPHDPEMGFKYVLPYEYNPKAKAPVFMKFCEDVTGGDQVLKNTLLEFGGYALSGDECRFQKALVLEGVTGANGKSTFIDILKAVAGRGSYQTLSFAELNQIDRRASLDGALFNITEETPNKFMDTTTFKNLIGGGELNVRKLYKNSYPLRNRAKLIFSCNELPHSVDTSGGFFRRLLIIPFKQRFSIEKGNLDMHIHDKMIVELPGIFNVFHAAYDRLKKQGCFTKQTVKKDEDLAEYKEMTDPVLAWWGSEVTVEDLKKSARVTPVKTLYKSYKVYCEEFGTDRRDIIPKARFEKRLRSLVPDYHDRADRAYVTEGGEKLRARVLKGLVCQVYGEEDY